VLVLKRKEGQWVEVTHKSGDKIRIRVYRIREGQADLAFDDDDRNFSIQRPERKLVAP
jgi:sRNA-binding carbon storage regulator CsrA